MKFAGHCRAWVGQCMTSGRAGWTWQGASLKLFLLPVLMHAGINYAEAPGEALPVVTTALAIHQMKAEDAAKAYPVLLRAVVTYYDPSPDPRHSVFFVSDKTGSTYVSLSSTPLTPLKPGDLVEVTGVTGSGEFAPVVDFARARQIGAGQLPRTAPRVTLADMATGEFDSQWVEIQGVVHAVHTSGRHLYVDIALRDGDIIAMTANEGIANYEPLVDATVTLRGNEGTIFNKKRQMIGAHLLFPGQQTLRVDAVAPAKAFELPLERVVNLLRYSTAAGLHHRTHVQGIVTLDWPGRLLCVQDEAQGLCAEIEQTDSLHRGDRVDLVGFPIAGQFTPKMVHAIYRLTGAHKDTHPAVVTSDQALLGGSDSELVTIEGRLIGHDLSALDATIVLQSGESVFLAVLPHKYLAEDLQLEEGSLLKITGICSDHSDGSKLDSRSGFPIATSFRILRGSPADVRILELPSWWNARHTLHVLALALMLALAGLIGVMILSRRVKSQTDTIRESEERFRHLATHDSLTQLPNRASVLNSLDAAIAKARNRNSSVCVALVDLDHFKNINDTYGHAAGDAVLRETARRLASAIRSSDVIGRYGGEEFLIVFNDMEKDHGVARCEVVRQTVCERPMQWEGNELTITCSIGVAAATSTHNPVPALVSIADHAMYAAKMQGRNRVVGAPDVAPECEVSHLSWPIAAISSVSPSLHHG